MGGFRRCQTFISRSFTKGLCYPTQPFVITGLSLSRSVEKERETYNMDDVSGDPMRRSSESEVTPSDDAGGQFEEQMEEAQAIDSVQEDLDELGSRGTEASEDSGDFFEAFSKVGDVDGVEETFTQVTISDVASDLIEQEQRVVTGTPGLLWPELTDQAELLYEEAVFSVSHALGSNSEFSSEDLNGLLKDIFQFSDEQHVEILERVQEKTAPKVSLQVKLVQGRNLPQKDVNGLSDPFCVLYLSSDKQNQQNSSMKQGTLDPVWNESFQFSVTDVQEDTLCVEAWDFDPEENFTEKVSRFGEVKGCKGFGKLLKEIATVSKSSGKSAHDFLGSFHLPLKAIPMNGVEKWFPLEGREKSKTKQRGDIQLGVSLLLQDEKTDNTEGNLQRYSDLVKVLVDYKLNSDPKWRGELTSVENILLHQFGLHQHLKQWQQSVIYWSVLSCALRHRTLNFQLLYAILDQCQEFLQDGDIDAELDSMFWKSAAVFGDAALLIVRYIDANKNVSSTPEQLEALLKCLKELIRLDLSRNGDQGYFSDFRIRLQESISMSAADWCSHAVGERKEGGPISDDDRVENAVRVANKLMSHLKTSLSATNELFCRHLQIPYYVIIYNYFDGQLASLCKPMVSAVTRSLKSLNLTEEQLASAALQAAGELEESAAPTMEDNSSIKKFNPKVTMGTALFELYMTLQQFYKLSSALPEPQREILKLNGFHAWFSAAVARWLDIALYKALVRIGKAVSMDTFIPIDNLVKHSSSAVDTLSIFYQIRTFWNQLSWPDPEEALTFVTKIIDDICRCCSAYASVVLRKVNKLDCQVDGRFQATSKICCAVNNIVYVKKSIKSLTDSLGLDCLYAKLEEQQQQSDGQGFTTIDTLVRNSEENIDASLQELFFFISKSIEEEVLKMFAVDWDTSAGLIRREEVIRYLDQNLITIHSKMEADVFDEVLHAISDHVFYGVAVSIQLDAEKKRPPSYFSHWDELVKMLVNFFFGSAEAACEDNELIKKIRKLLHLHTAETSQLIQQYYLERMALEESNPGRNYGSLTIRSVFVGDTLTVEVINGRDLTPMDTSGSSDPYVRICPMPAATFANQVQQTKVHKSTLFPLFDETFTFNVPPEFHLNPDCFVLFTLKDRDLIGPDDFAAEAFLPFQNIPRGDSADDLKSMEQISLPLRRPRDKSSECFRVLEKRSWDKTAKEFVKLQAKFLENN